MTTEVVALDERAEELRSAFNRDAGRPRLLMLVSPTCGPCRDGAAVMQRDVLAQVDDPSLRIYATWVPILSADSLQAARSSSGIVQDSRAAHFWDAQKALPGPFAAVLGLPDGWPAWDVYAVYPAGITWDDAPPAPAFWQHQLGPEPEAPILDGNLFRSQLQRLLNREA